MAMLQNCMMTDVVVLSEQKVTLTMVSLQRWTLTLGHASMSERRTILHGDRRNGTARSAMHWRHRCLQDDQPLALNWQLQRIIFTVKQRQWQSRKCFAICFFKIRVKTFNCDLHKTSITQLVQINPLSHSIIYNESRPRDMVCSKSAQCTSVQRAGYPTLHSICRVFSPMVTVQLTNKLTRRHNNTLTSYKIEV